MIALKKIVYSKSRCTVSGFWFFSAIITIDTNVMARLLNKKAERFRSALQFRQRLCYHHIQAVAG